MKIYRSLIKGIVIFEILVQGAAFAIDFGTRAQVFKITEEPFIVMLKNRLEKIDLVSEQKKIQAKAKHRVENPISVEGINPATENRVFYFDPSYILDKDAVLPCGRILHKAGTKVNPLASMDLSRRLFFIDGRQERQVTWLKERLKLPLAEQEDKEAVEDRVILVAGSVFKLQELLGQKHDGKVYFDQAGELTYKFGIKASPAIVEQEGLMLKIEEVVLNE